MRNLVKEDFKGVISIEEHGKWVFKQAYGEADLANQRLNRLETKFPMASGSKVFIAVAILQLIEGKFISFDSTLGQLLPFDWHHIDKNITVRQLLTHTSGLPDYFDESLCTDYAKLWENYPNYRIRTSQDLLPLFLHKRMAFPKGQKFQYNNAGYVVLGLIIEAVTKLPFDRYLEKIIFTPCEMEDTGYYELDRLPLHCATGYCLDEDTQTYYSNIYSLDVKGSGAGGAYTTAKDMDRFWTCLMKGRLISQPMVNEMLSPQVKEDWYGYGVWLKSLDDGHYLPFIQGSDPGISFISSYDRQKCRTMTMMSNFAQDVWTLHGNFYKALNN
ncbi:beta-lactamase family protein [Turicibacter bilis]|uniref:Beta-lactamase family protein n=1 Tax=Turicibacter bilis TaxID=2735723 RepID=A0A9Q9CQ52_9FIRM|nr:serine hydrolase domain-containing protein [Turicibacter bilis]MBP3908574.1 beta-lactamase family protein [Turicibacter sp.]MBS3197939.1 beta-lactamase family protein [Turicibacter bilis]UUF07927.1 beta-lactamase family protein [Turicibacter bilis]